MPRVRLPPLFHRLLVAHSTKRILVGLLGLAGLLAAGLVNQTTHSASLSSVSATLSNSRPSFRGALSAGNTEGTSRVLINTTAGAYPSTSAAQLIAGDSVSIGSGGNMGHYTVTDVLDDGSFTISGTLGSGQADAGNDVISTQSANLTVRFATTNAVSDGAFRVLVPAHSDVDIASDGIPDGGVFDANPQDSLAGEIERYSGPSTLVEETFTIQGNSLPVEIYHYSSDLTLSSNTDFGSATPDERMVVVKVDGNFTVDSGVTLTTTARKLGLVFYVGGDTQIDGTIDMTARGANHSPSGSNIEPFDLTVVSDIGENGILPAEGGEGGARKSITNGHNPGQAGTSGGTGGGGSGGRTGGTSNGQDGTTHISGAGAAGTLWSGGGGGGGQAGGVIGEDAEPRGGKGGDAVSSDRAAGGGAGNPGGTWDVSNFGTAENGDDGTGGLIVLVSLDTITIGSTGIVRSNGSDGGGTDGGGRAGGGGSGGGSVNLYYLDGGIDPILWTP